MKTITVGQLRQNPTAMLGEVEQGTDYVVTNHGRQVAHIVPMAETAWTSNRGRVDDMLASHRRTDLTELLELVEEAREAETGSAA